MKRVLFIIAIGLALVLVKTGMTPLLGMVADLVIILPPFYLWLKGRRSLSIGVLLSACLINDAVLPTSYPLFTLSALAVGSLYIVILEPLVSADNAITKGLAVFLWITLWRLAYSGTLALSAVVFTPILTPHTPGFLQVIGWFLGGATGWFILWSTELAVRRVKKNLYGPAV